MTDLQRASDLHERQQISSRISELSLDCERLVQTKNDLIVRLSKLNDVTDKLLIEKQTKKYDPSLKIDLAINNGIPTSSISPLHRIDHTSSNDQNHVPSETNDLRYQYRHTGDFGSAMHMHERNSAGPVTQKPPESGPSNAFKFKLSHYLDEVLRKSDELNRLADQIGDYNNN